MKENNKPKLLTPTGVPSLPETYGKFDGRENECLDYVRRNAKLGDATSVVEAIDKFCYTNKWMMNVGDVKGKILEEVLDRHQPRVVLELGTYVGYSSLKMIQRLPKESRIYSLEISPKIAEIARAMIEYAGMDDRINVVDGCLQDPKTSDYLERHIGFTQGSVDFAFFDHAREVYVPDLKVILESGWFHKGSVVFADNVLYPGAPEYKKFMAEQEGSLFNTTMTETFLEYQSKVKDIVFESVYLGGYKKSRL